MAHPPQNNMLAEATSALEALVDDPQLLDRARHRFSESPTYRSGTPTESCNSTLSETQEAAFIEKHKWDLRNERLSSAPRTIFHILAKEEEIRLSKLSHNSTTPAGKPLVDENLIQLAEETVKKQWMEQGIWHERWNFGIPVPWMKISATEAGISGPWKHEYPRDLNSESEAIPTQPASVKSLQQITEWQLLQERQREASRPFYQFLYQVSKERERVQNEISSHENATGAHTTVPPDISTALSRTTHHQPMFSAWAWQYLGLDEQDAPRADTPIPFDINTMAYERVKELWNRNGIWDRRWGVLPGMSWKHEQSQDDFFSQELPDCLAAALENGAGPSTYLFTVQLPVPNRISWPVVGVSNSPNPEQLGTKPPSPDLPEGDQPQHVTRGASEEQCSVFEDAHEKESALSQFAEDSFREKPGHLPALPLANADGGKDRAPGQVLSKHSPDPVHQASSSSKECFAVGSYAQVPRDRANDGPNISLAELRSTEPSELLNGRVNSDSTTANVNPGSTTSNVNHRHSESRSTEPPLSRSEPSINNRRSPTTPLAVLSSTSPLEASKAHEKTSRLPSGYEESASGLEVPMITPGGAHVLLRRSTRLQDAKRRRGPDDSVAAVISRDDSPQPVPASSGAGAPQSVPLAQPRRVSKKRRVGA